MMPTQGYGVGYSGLVTGGYSDIRDAELIAPPPVIKKSRVRGLSRFKELFIEEEEELILPAMKIEAIAAVQKPAEDRRKMLIVAGIVTFGVGVTLLAYYLKTKGSKRL